jgi:hypothetical protein
MPACLELNAEHSRSRNLLQRQDRTGQVRIGQDKSGQDRTGQGSCWWRGALFTAVIDERGQGKLYHLQPWQRPSRGEIGTCITIACYQSTTSSMKKIRSFAYHDDLIQDEHFSAATNATRALASLGDKSTPTNFAQRYLGT